MPIEVIEARDAFGLVVGFRGVVRITLPCGATGLVGCTCVTPHPTEHDARRCDEARAIIESTQKRRAAA